jgi:hypothetical protein
VVAERHPSMRVDGRLRLRCWRVWGVVRRMLGRSMRAERVPAVAVAAVAAAAGASVGEGALEVHR